jgi:hypothetical protein
MAIDVNEIAGSLRQFVRNYNAQFQKLSARKSQLLEIGALMIAAKHYELSGYDVSLHNPRGGQLRVKLSTRGDPWNFSRFEAVKGRRHFEIHTNLPVADALSTKGARYVADVVVVPAGSVPRAKPPAKWQTLPNASLITFIEAKALVIYPMLIAQFIGIVHELKPGFLLGKRPSGFRAAKHFDPALVSLGYLHGTCWNIVAGFKSRKLYIRIVPEFDRAIARLNYEDCAESPLAHEA